MPTFRVHVLETGPEFWDGLLLADVPAGQQASYAKPEGSSEPTVVSTTDNTAIIAGTVTERRVRVSVPVESRGQTPANIAALMRSAFENLWAKFNNEIANLKPREQFGFKWDGTNWTR